MSIRGRLRSFASRLGAAYSTYRRASNRRAAQAAKVLRQFAGEILTSVAALAGWALLTASVASLLPHTGSRSIWFASTGLFLLSLCGWKFLRKIATDGLYVLTRPKRA